jgi:hypothetical protein
MEDAELRGLFNEMNIKLDAVSRTVSNLETNSRRVDNKLSKIEIDTGLIPEILEIVTANGQGIETISSRVDRLESIPQ